MLNLDLLQRRLEDLEMDTCLFMISTTSMMIMLEMDSSNGNYP